MSIPVPGSGSTESVPTWVSPAQQDAARAASIESMLPEVDGVASVFPPAGVDLAGFAPEGVKVNDERVEVHIIAEYGSPLQTTADNIDRAVQPLLDGRDLQIVVDDILLPGESLPEPVPEPEPEPQPEPELESELEPGPESGPTQPGTTEQKPDAATDPTVDSTSVPTSDTGGDSLSEATTGADPEPQAGVTVTVAPESAAEVTITTDQQGGVQVDVPATQVPVKPGDGPATPGEDNSAADERTPGV